MARAMYSTTSGPTKRYAISSRGWTRCAWCEGQGTTAPRLRIMFFLSKHFRNLNARYHGPEGDDFAAAELNPVAVQFVPRDGSVLEVGCGYGRNLVALSRLRVRRVVGCDVQFDELVRARRRLTPLDPVHRARVQLVQQEPWRLPFPDACIDLVVLWQV